MRRIQRSDLMDMGQGFHGRPRDCKRLCRPSRRALTCGRGGLSVATVLALALVLLALGPAPEVSASPGTARVLIQTLRGDIVVEVDTARAPVTAANFLR